ncbi:Tat pathway signal protein [Halothiobacillus diazotrophicus]|uniref:Tat pathway signal protein n=1 Tax=Halothiobacillus diazotrophicus TaxID=1860122 RepID=A0A191ZEP4_9GAMM|nr:beta-1,3-glucanase family protein [Halothiobacillus diazotrophicus]ANJ66330.1 Tat pathway signal protein [Halothiobacillus diazotrophicus]
MDELDKKRRAFITVVASSVAVAACGGSGSSTGGSSSGGAGTGGGSTGGGTNPTAKIPLTIDASTTDLPAGAQVYAYIVGEVKVSGVSSQYRLDAQGVPHLMTTADNTQPAGTFPDSNLLSTTDATAIAANYPLAWADYSIPLSRTTPTVIDLANLSTTNLPGLGTGTAAFSGRIYISVGIPKLPFTVIDSTKYTAPVPDAYPGQLTVFDWIEFSFDSLGNFNGNTTQVDQFGFPLTLNGTPGGTLQGALNQSRANILSTFNGLTGNFAGLAKPVSVPAAYPAGITYLRAVSPKTVTAQTGYTGTLQNYFNGAVNKWYSNWEVTPLVTNDTSTGYYSGYVPLTGAYAGMLAFYQGNFPTLADFPTTAPDFTLGSGTTPQIPTLDVWQCANSLATGTAAQKNVQKMIAAAFNRGVMSYLLNDNVCTSPSTYYPTATGSDVSNTWAQMFHAYSTNGLAYGFPYDDVCNQNPSIQINGTQSITVTLGKFFS